MRIAVREKESTTLFVYAVLFGMLRQAMWIDVNMLSNAMNVIVEMYVLYGMYWLLR